MLTFLCLFVPTFLGLLMIAILIEALQGKFTITTYLRSLFSPARKPLRSPSPTPQQRLQNHIKLGPQLRRRYGTQSTYSSSQVKDTLRTSGYSSSDDCYALAMYCSPEEFDDFHRTVGETCNYAEMRGSINDTIQELCPMDSGIDRTWDPDSTISYVLSQEESSAMNNDASGSSWWTSLMDSSPSSINVDTSSDSGGSWWSGLTDAFNSDSSSSSDSGSSWSSDSSDSGSSGYDSGGSDY